MRHQQAAAVADRVPIERAHPDGCVGCLPRRSSRLPSTASRLCPARAYPPAVRGVSSTRRSRGPSMVTSPVSLRKDLWAGSKMASDGNSLRSLKRGDQALHRPRHRDPAPEPAFPHRPRPASANPGAGSSRVRERLFRRMHNLGSDARHPGQPVPSRRQVRDPSGRLCRSASVMTRATLCGAVCRSPRRNRHSEARSAAWLSGSEAMSK